MSENAPKTPRESGAGTVDFGYQEVPAAEKARRVRDVFDSVGRQVRPDERPDVGGMHRLWKRYLLGQTGLRPGQAALDVAGGTGDLAAGMAKQVGERGLVVLSDINERDARARPRPPARRGPRAQRALRRSRTPSACRSPTRASTA